MSRRITQTAPILRIFDEALAREFYPNFLGSTVEFEHRFDDGAPLYLSVTMAGAVPHLSGHFGDATPGGTVFLRCTGLAAYQRQLLAERHKHARPGLRQQDWGTEMSVTDPFGNTLRFSEG